MTPPYATKIPLNFKAILLIRDTKIIVTLDTGSTGSFPKLHFYGNEAKHINLM